MKKNIAVVMGGYTSEYSISLISGSVVVKHLDKNKYDVYPVIMEQNGWKVVLGQEEFPMDKTDFSAVIHGKKITFDLNLTFGCYKSKKQFDLFNAC